MNKATKQYLYLKFDKKPFENKTEVKIQDFSSYYTLANIPKLLKKDSKSC